MQPKIVNIIQGGQAVFVVRLINPLTGVPYDLTGWTLITTCFLNDDGTELMLSTASGGGLSVLDAVNGRVQVTIAAAQSLLLRPLKLGTLEFAITFSGDPIKAQKCEAYNVLQTVC